MEVSAVTWFHSHGEGVQVPLGQIVQVLAFTGVGLQTGHHSWRAGGGQRQRWPPRVGRVKKQGDSLKGWSLVPREKEISVPSYPSLKVHREAKWVQSPCHWMASAHYRLETSSLG